MPFGSVICQQTKTGCIGLTACVKPSCAIWCATGRTFPLVLPREYIDPLALYAEKARLNALRGHLAEGAAQAARGEFSSESLQDMLQDFRKSPDGLKV